MRHIFLTGGTGEFGQHILRHLCASEAEIYALVRPRIGESASDRVGQAINGPLPPNLHLIEGDLSDHGLGLSPKDRQLLKQEKLIVLHAAAPARFNFSEAEAKAKIILPTKNLIQFVGRLNLDRLVHISTAFASGRNTGRILEETLPDRGFVNNYDRSKYEAEGLVQRSRLPNIILRPSLVVAADSPSHHAAVAVLSLIKAQALPILPGLPDDQVDLITADEAARAVVRLIDSPLGVYHVSSGDKAPRLGEIISMAQSKDFDIDYLGHNPDIFDAKAAKICQMNSASRGVYDRIGSFVHYLSYPKVFDNKQARAQGVQLGLDDPLIPLRQALRS